jgi:hypothetical protein
METLPTPPHQTLRAKIAAAYLYADDADPSAWLGLSDRNVNYDEVIDRTDPLVLRTVRFDLERGRFAIDELGERAYVQAVHSEDDPDLIIDILAWSATRPHLYGTFFGHAALLGGDAVLNPASFVEAPCPIWTSPLAWLQSSLRGAVVLNAELAAPILARGPGLFQCEDADHARWLVESGAVAVDKLMVPGRTAA